VLGIVTGMVAGLGTITPASGFVGPFGALVIGITAGVVCFYATQYVKRVLKIDDSLTYFRSRRRRRNRLIVDRRFCGKRPGRPRFG